MKLLDLDAYAGLKEFAFMGGKAVIWGVSAIDWGDHRPTPLGNHTVSAWVNDTKVMEKQLTYEEAAGLDTVIGFSFTDALGCKYGFGAIFAKRS